MIPRDTIEKIFSAAHIEEVVSEYVTLKKRGANLIGLCPFHDEKTGSFTVSPSKGIYKCFGCGKSGHAAGFIMEIEQCSYVEALRILAKKYHIEIEERELTPEEKQNQDDRESMGVVNEFAAQWFENQLWNTPEGQAIGLSYLRQRGVTDTMIHKFRIGYSPDKSLLAPELVKQGYQEKYILNDSQTAPYIGTGVCLKSEDERLYDRFHSRVIFPFFSPSGKVIGFAGRLLKQSDKVGKYVNSPTSPLFEKKNQLFGLYQAKQAIVRLNRCFLVEGQMDVISMYQAGIENVVASGGTSLTQPQIKLMHRFTKNITILYDGDKAGIKAALRGIDMILQEGISVKVVLLPEGEDPDSFARSHNASDFIDFIEKNQTDFIRFKALLLAEEAGNDPIKRTEFIHSIVQSIAAIPDIITRQVYVKDCAEMLHMSEQMFANEVAKLRHEQIRTTAPATKQQTYIPSSFEENILNLLQLIIRYGERPLFATEDGTQTSVGEYIISELTSEKIEPVDAVHKLILEEFMAHFRESGFVSQTFFLRHADLRISHIAVELMADRYQLSKIFLRQPGEKRELDEEEELETIEQPQVDTNMLQETTQRLLLELKLTIINQQIEGLQTMLNQAQAQGNWDTIRFILSEQPRLLALRTQICDILGNRVVTV